MIESEQEKVFEEMLPKALRAERQDPFEWVEPDDKYFENLDVERRKLMQSLNEGQLMLADLFYQSKPEIEKKEIVVAAKYHLEQY